MSWKIEYPPEYFVDLAGVVVAPTTRQVPNFNGISQYAAFQNTVLSGDFEISFNYSATNKNKSSLQAFVGGTGEYFVALWSDGGVRMYIGNNLVFNVSSSLIPDSGFMELSRVSGAISARVNGVEFANGNNSMDFEIFQLGRVGSGNYFEGLIYNFKINDGSVYNFPMDDGWTNNPAMRNTGTGADGTFINMTEASWQEINL